MQNIILEEDEDDDQVSETSRSGNTYWSGGSGGNTITDFFSPDVFRLVIHNPTTAYRFLKFCQSRNCGEAMDFLQKVCE